MRIGCCFARAETLGQIARCGFDYAEMLVTETLVPEQPDSAFAATRRAVREAPVPVEAFHGFLPPDLRVTGPDVDRQRVDHYVRTALERVAELGAKVVVFGSGDARRVPDGFSRAVAGQQLVELLRRIGDIAMTYEIGIAIEHLNPTEDNLVTSFASGLSLSREVDHPAVGVLADLYHLQMTGEALPDPSQDLPLLHVHVADIGRRPPAPGPALSAFADWLARVGYDGRVSIEAFWRDLDHEGPPAIAAMDRLRNVA